MHLSNKQRFPGSLVSEPKHRDSRLKSQLGIGIGIEIQAWKVSESVLERNSDIPSLGIGTGIESQTFQVSESEPESKFSVSRIFPLIATPILV